MEQHTRPRRMSVVPVEHAEGSGITFVSRPRDQALALQPLHEPRARGLLPCRRIETSFRELSERGVPFDDEVHLIARMPDHDLWLTFFRDPEDNLLGLMAEVRPPAAR